MRDKIAKKDRQRTELQVKRVGFVAICNVLPAMMVMAEGGATPIRVPEKKGKSGTPMIGEPMLINQLGSIGVMRRNMI